MADRYYVNSSNTKETQTVYIRRNEERIVFIGSQIHRPIDDLKSFIGAFLFDVNKWSKMMFVHQALREVDQNKENDWTVLLCTQGYTPLQINTIKNYFNRILKKDGSQTVRYIKEITNLDEILYYINRGDETTNRRLYMISKLVFFCHGDVRGLSPWMGDIKTDFYPYIDEGFVSKIERFPFDSAAEIYSYGCRTGLGNRKIDKSTKELDPMCENSLAQVLANTTGANVFAYLRRTDYSDTLLNEKERDVVENKYSNLTEEEKIEYKQLYEIWMTNKYEVDGEILYPKGARYPVTAADTPEGLPLDMKMYWDIT